MPRSLNILAPPPAWAVDLALLALRLWVGLVMPAAHGLGKARDLAGFTAKVAERGIPLPGLLGPAAAMSELAGGILIALGLGTRIAALFLLVTMLVAGFHIHAADPFGKKELAFTYAVASLVLLLSGSGRYGLDGVLLRRFRR